MHFLIQLEFLYSALTVYAYLIILDLYHSLLLYALKAHLYFLMNVIYVFFLNFWMPTIFIIWLLAPKQTKKQNYMLKSSKCSWCLLFLFRIIFIYAYIHILISHREMDLKQWLCCLLNYHFYIILSSMAHQDPPSIPY